jgi:hypothetical protein
VTPLPAGAVDVADVATLVFSASLVVVTTVYVVLTARILGANERASRAAVDAADVARETLSELQQQRLQSVRPRLTATGVKLTWYGERLDRIDIAVRNVGQGAAFAVALVVRVAPAQVWGEASSPNDPLVNGGEQEVEVRSNGAGECPGDLFVDLVCFDVYGSEVRSEEVFRVEPGKATAPKRWPPPAASVALGSPR